jgi:hypothetical protein
MNNMLGSGEITLVVSSVNRAVLSARSTVRASSGVPGVAIVAVGVSASDVGPPPVGVEHNGTLLGCAAGTTGASASLPGELRVGLGSDCADLLSAGSSEERDGSESESPVHGCCSERTVVGCWKNFVTVEICLI